MSRLGDPPIHSLFTPAEIAEIDATTHKGDTMTVGKTRTYLPQTYAEKIAALPTYPTSGQSRRTRLDRLAESAMSTLSALDAELERIADDLTARLDEDDRRAANADRLRSLAKTHRDAQRR